jgi:hypothetical protein
MGLSRLDNFLKNVRGNLLYVDPNSIDATDGIENQGNSLTRPFKTIQRALIEAARFSYQRGLDNDRFGKTTIILYPGDHLVDNRPGWIPNGANNFIKRSGETTSDFLSWDSLTNFDLTTENNTLYKLNSVHGGVILPRGTSIVGMDLRKTRIRPTYVPNPTNDNIERSAIFRVTGACYLWQFTILDADPNGNCYLDYSPNLFVPNFSHHKLAAFEYADGVNDVSIDDAFVTYSTNRTDLDIYYEKVGLAYGDSTGRPISPDYPSDGVDIQTVVDEYRIVGSKGSAVGISSIKSGDGVSGTTDITVTLTESLPGLNVDTPIQISGVSSPGYDGQYTVSEVLNNTQIQYQVQNVPADVLPSTAGATLNISVDTVTSASPYIFNISMRSVYGLCGLLADGDKASGFKSMVVAQFTGIGLQKDDNAFVKYDSSAGQYNDSTTVVDLHTNSQSRFKPEYENFHIKGTNDAFLQLVSIFAIGYAKHFECESGGDLSITNSNSNFGAKALNAVGFKREAFPRDDIGYVTHIITPKEIESSEVTFEFNSIDVATTVGIASTNRLYLYNELNEDIPPQTVIDGYRVGARANDTIHVLLSQSGIVTQYSAKIIMPDTQYTATETDYEKVFTVGRNVGINSIGLSGSNIITLTENHTFLSGESIRVISDNGHLPDGIAANQIYFAITDGGLASNEIKLAATLNDVVSDNEIEINTKGGVLQVVSRVSDKNSGDAGHPVQFDSNTGQWYVNVATAASENSIYPIVVGLGTANLGEATPRTYLTRTPDNRILDDTIYRVRYVIPKDSITLARPPLEGSIIQESNNVIGAGTTEIQKYFSPTPVTISNSTELRNPRFIAGAEWDGTYAQIKTEVPHNLSVGSKVEIVNVVSSSNPVGVANSAFNGTFTVAGISSTKVFTYELDTNPGTFQNNTSTRNESLPYFKRKETSATYSVYKVDEIQPYIQNTKDGVYHLTIINHDNHPTVSPFTDLKFSQPLRNLYPQTNRDHPQSDPKASVCFALSTPIGQVVVDEPQNSITKETLQKTFDDYNVGFGITDIVSSTDTSHTIYTEIDHGFAGIATVSIVSGGLNYGFGSGNVSLYNAKLVGFAGSTTGENAAALITVDGSGTITNVQIMDGGSAYGIGNTLSVVGVATTNSFQEGVIRVESLQNSINNTVSITGIRDSQVENYNTLYKIDSIAVGKSKELSVTSCESISGYSTTGVGVTVLERAVTTVNGKALGISTMTYNGVTGIATITFNTTHGYRVDNKLRIGGADNPSLNRDFIVKRVNNLTTLTVNPGVTTGSTSTGGNITVYRYEFASSGGDLSDENENTSGRLVPIYAGITTTLGMSATSSASSITIDNAQNLGIQLGDYLMVDNEIMRVRSTVVGNNVSVFRGLLGTLGAAHAINSLVTKIKPSPIEFRRNSLIRASGHTFEYLGFGPGNYSTALPERQDRILSPIEELLGQATKVNGGLCNFTGMTDTGNFYTGTKKLIGTTSKEEVFDAPIPTVTGEDISVGSNSLGYNTINPLEALVDRSITVSGGPDGNIISEFNGPVVFNQKITSTSEKGIEVGSMFIKGEQVVSRKYTVGIATPTESGNPGDVVYNSNPTSGGYLGWVYVADNRWEPFGQIANVGVFT